MVYYTVVRIIFQELICPKILSMYCVCGTTWSSESTTRPRGICHLFGILETFPRSARAILQAFTIVRHTPNNSGSPALVVSRSRGQMGRKLNYMSSIALHFRSDLLTVELPWLFWCMVVLWHFLRQTITRPRACLID